MSDAERLGDVARRVVDDLDWRRRLDCVHQRCETRKKPIANGRFMFQKQCLDCGSGVGTAIAAAQVVDKSAEWDAAAAAAYARSWDERDKHTMAEFDDVAAQRTLKQDEWWAKYNAYLCSPDWRAIRSAVLKRDGGVCQACLERQAGEVHHLTYDHVFNEPLFDLVAVCKPCHDKLTHLDRCARDGYRYTETIREW